jgi:hypothetical protein
MKGGHHPSRTSKVTGGKSITRNKPFSSPKPAPPAKKHDTGSKVTRGKSYCD